MLNLDAVGMTSSPKRRSWDERDSLLYAVGVGAGSLDATGAELEFTTENSIGLEQRVLPTFATIICLNGIDLSILGEFDVAKQLHGFERITLYGALPPSGSLDITTKVEGIYDKGSGALVVFESTGSNIETGAPLVSTRTGVFIVGAGGFGASRGPEQPDLSTNIFVDREPDDVVRYVTRPDQALTYRLNGDRNPLHADPTFARREGFERPILHGLCTYGFVGRALLHTLCDSDPLKFGTMDARFSRPVYPGDELFTKIWDDGNESPGTYRFQVANQHDDVVLNSGYFQVATRR